MRWSRVRAGVSVFQADRRHLHYRLKAFGWSERRIAWTFFFITVVIAILALLTEGMMKFVAILIFILSAVFYVLSFVERRTRRISCKYVSKEPAVGLVVAILDCFCCSALFFWYGKKKIWHLSLWGGRLIGSKLPRRRFCERWGFGREKACVQRVMLFLFERPGAYKLDERNAFSRYRLVTNGSISHIERRVPTDSREALVPDQEADFVIEFNAGAMDGVRVGDHVGNGGLIGRFPRNQNPALRLVFFRKKNGIPVVLSYR